MKYTDNMLFLIDKYGTISWNDFIDEDEMLDAYNEYKDVYVKILFLTDFNDILFGKYDEILNDYSKDKLKNIRESVS
jgi:uncharacterized protein YutD